MQDEPITSAADAVDAAFAALRAGVQCAAAAGKIAGLQACHRVTRQADQLMISLLGGLQRDGAFSERGYRRPAAAVADLLGCDTSRAQRWVRVAEDVCDRVEISGQVNPPRLPSTAVAFAEGAISLCHAEVLVAALNTRAARRLSLDVRAGAEETLAGQARLYQPLELAAVTHRLINLLDQDGPEPDDKEPQQLNELCLHPDRASGGGTIKGTLDAPTYEPSRPRSRRGPSRYRMMTGPCCNATPSWCEHHIRKWEHQGETEITNLVMLCSFRHHLLHRDSQWTVRIRDGLPEFIPPIWIDPNQIPRRKPPPTFAA